MLYIPAQWRPGPWRHFRIRRRPPTRFKSSGKGGGRRRIRVTKQKKIGAAEGRRSRASRQKRRVLERVHVGRRAAWHELENGPKASRAEPKLHYWCLFESVSLGRVLFSPIR